MGKTLVAAELSGVAVYLSRANCKKIKWKVVPINLTAYKWPTGGDAFV
jgi:hypothetical protein